MCASLLSPLAFVRVAAVGRVMCFAFRKHGRRKNRGGSQEIDGSVFCIQRAPMTLGPQRLPCTPCLHWTSAVGLPRAEEMKASLVVLPVLASCTTAFVLHAPPTAVGGPTSPATATRPPTAGRLAEVHVDATCTSRRYATCTHRRCER